MVLSKQFWHRYWGLTFLCSNGPLKSKKRSKYVLPCPSITHIGSDYIITVSSNRFSRIYFSTFPITLITMGDQNFYVKLDTVLSWLHNVAIVSDVKHGRDLKCEHRVFTMATYLWHFWSSKRIGYYEGILSEIARNLPIQLETSI